MANVEFQNATAFRRITAGKVQTAESVRISVKSDIAEVYSVGVENVVNSYDVRQGEVAFYGKTALKFLYSDGSQVCGSTYNADFTASVANEEITPDSKCVFDVQTVDVKTETNANIATISILLEITVFAYVGTDVVYFSDSDDCFVKKDGVEVLQEAGVSNLSFALDEELSSQKSIDSVCLADSNLCITDYTNVDNVLHIYGEAVVRLTYVSNGNLVGDALTFKFHTELDSSGIPSSAQLFLTPQVRGTKVRLNIAENSVNTDFSVEIAANLCVEWSVVGVWEVVSDAYGPSCDFDFVRKTFSTTLPCGSASAKKKVTGTLPIEGEKSLVAVVNVGATVISCTSLEKSARIEGVVFATALFDTESALAAEPVELPFVQTIDVDFLAPQCESFADVGVCDFAITDDGAFTATAELCISVDAMRSASYSVVAEAEEKPFDKKQLPAIEVCLAHKGETLWTLAKGLHMSEEDLLAVNPEIASPLERDARIVVYNKI